MIQNDDFDAQFLEPTVTTLKICRFADDDATNIELPHESRAIPAR